MSIYEVSYAIAVIAYRNTDALEKRHASEDNAADIELYESIESEFRERWNMFEKIMPVMISGDGVRDLEPDELELYLYSVLISKGYTQWDMPVYRDEVIGGDIADYILQDVKKSCMRHERLTQDVMKRLNRGVYGRVYSALRRS